jgi:hypothetical protein
MTTTHVTAKTNGKVLPDMTAMQARLEELEKQNAALLAAKNVPLTMKIKEKGALSVYGLQRFPVTLYRQQWERLIAFVPEMQAFIEKHAGELTTKS